MKTEKKAKKKAEKKKSIHNAFNSRKRYKSRATNILLREIHAFKQEKTTHQIELLEEQKLLHRITRILDATTEYVSDQKSGELQFILGIFSIAITDLTTDLRSLQKLSDLSVQDRSKARSILYRHQTAVTWVFRRSSDQKQLETKGLFFFPFDQTCSALNIDEEGLRKLIAALLSSRLAAMTRDNLLPELDLSYLRRVSRLEVDDVGGDSSRK